MKKNILCTVVFLLSVLTTHAWDNIGEDFKKETGLSARFETDPNKKRLQFLSMALVMILFLPQLIKVIIQ